MPIFNEISPEKAWESINDSLLYRKIELPETFEDFVVILADENLAFEGAGCSNYTSLELIKTEGQWRDNQFDHPKYRKDYEYKVELFQYFDLVVVKVEHRNELKESVAPRGKYGLKENWSSRHLGFDSEYKLLTIKNNTFDSVKSLVDWLLI